MKIESLVKVVSPDAVFEVYPDGNESAALFFLYESTSGNLDNKVLGLSAVSSATLTVRAVGGLVFSLIFEIGKG